MIGLAGGLLAASGLLAQTDYPLTADSQRQPGVPAGVVTQHSWTSRIFPGTVRDYWVYVPAQYKPEVPAAVMVFQDGGGFVGEQGRWRVPIVFDNLIHKGEMPVTIGIFINPGVLPPPSAEQEARYNRSYEYDGLGDRYARFLLEEILPEVAKTHSLTSDPNLRAIAGSSSGGIAAFTVAWSRPDAFRRVLSFIGSYTNLRGGNVYASLVRKTEPKPLRIFLQDGSGDLNLYSGNWWLANQDLASALAYAGYDSTFVTGDQLHNNVHGSAILPDALRWLFRSWTEPIARSRGVAGAERHFVTQILDPDHDWLLVSEHHRSTGGLAVDRKGNVSFTDLPNHMAVNARGERWLTDAAKGQVWFVNGKGAKRVVHEGLQFPSGVALSPDQSLLAVAESHTKWVWSFQVAPDGSLLHGQPFYRLEVPDESSDSAAAGMTFDREGDLYVATRSGIQICDQPGRVIAILNTPQAAAPSSVVFGGPELDTLYVTAGDKVFRRVLRRKGTFPWQPVKPPTPRL
jgi:enterochelin esterase-like enzyme